MELFSTFTALPIELTPISVSLGALLFLVLVLIGITLRNTVSIHRLSYPVYDYTIRKAEEEAAKITRDARERAQAIVERAERDAAAHVKRQKSDADTLANHYEQQLKALAEHNTKLLERYKTLAHESYRAFDKAVQKESESAAQAVRDELDRLLEELRDEHAKLRRHFATKFQERLTEEFDAAREAVDQYREGQLRLIDNRIIALVERAAALAFQKELTVKDHTDMIFQSLEEAKREGVL